MKKLWIFIFSLIPAIGFSQNPPDGTNQISIPGVSFIQVEDSLMDRGYELKWIDNNYKTIRTTFKEAPNPSGRGSSYVYV